mgnify:CR=1 FL=1
MPKGPCIVCGATDYSLSMGGPSICSACDCGIPPEVTKLRCEVKSLRAEMEDRVKMVLEEHELERDLISQLCYEILEWYHGDDELMPQTLIDQLTAESHRLIEKAQAIRRLEE